ncbi:MULTISPECIES: hypothetical protein [unclassified Sphingopyxis]|uniref:hypothetical protein n=1 Tax=unclassified Sphingopyxis TaxID=2614943 RepID=UPI0007318B67|nr:MULTISPECIES: hypothetical protein [unclassified Sphingopyxis]KTE07143.1 hypothetical protein ATE70_20565 [Sphingopyxis sp. H053]
MTGHDERRRNAILSLPALSRALFLLHNFYGVEIGEMAGELGVNRDIIHTCLADARAIVRAHVCYTDPVPGIGSATAALQARLQRDYRQTIAAAFAESGYPNNIAWPDPIADIAADEEAATAFLVAQLSALLRKAVVRSRRAGVAAVDQWRFVGPWCRRRRDRLLRVNDALRCSGWQPFDEWLADRMVSDHRYPHGYADFRRRRRPLPEERPMTAAEADGDEIADTVQIPVRLVEQPELTRHVWIFFHHYGRSYEEIGRRLGIGRADVERRRAQAEYAILGADYPSLASRICFKLMVKRLSFEWRWEVIRSALYG